MPSPRSQRQPRVEQRMEQFRPGGHAPQRHAALEQQAAEAVKHGALVARGQALAHQPIGDPILERGVDHTGSPARVWYAAGLLVAMDGSVNVPQSYAVAPPDQSAAHHIPVNQAATISTYGGQAGKSRQSAPGM